MNSLRLRFKGGRFSRRTLQAGVASLTFMQPVMTFAQTQWVSTETRAHPTGNATFRAKLGDTESVEIVVGLRLRNADTLGQKIISQTTAGDLEFGHRLTKQQTLDDYAPTENQVQAVVSYLAKWGFTNIQVADNRILISASGTAAAVRNAFNTELAHFERAGRDGIANLSDAAVPSELTGTILSVLGLQTLDVAHTVGTLGSHNPVAFQTVYDAAGLASASNTAIGIITEGSMTQPIADLHTFEAQNGLPTINPTVVNVGGTSSDTTHQLEWDLDTQTIQAMAGGTLKQMLLYTSTSLNNSNLAATYNKAASDNIATVVNVSLAGTCQWV